MMRTVFAATSSAKKAMTTSRIRPACIAATSWSRAGTGPLHLADERGCAPNLDDVDAAAALDDVVVAVRARRPDLALELDPPAVGVDPRGRQRRLADERGGARAQLRGGAQVAAGDRAHEAEHEPGDEEEDDHRDRGVGSRQVGGGTGQGPDGERRE